MILRLPHVRAIAPLSLGLGLAFLAGCGQAQAPSALGTAAAAGPPDLTMLAVTADLAAQAVPGEVVVKLKPGGRTVSGLSQEGDVPRSAGMHVNGLHALAATGAAGTYVGHVAPGANVADTVDRLRTDPSVLYAEPNYLYRASAVTVNDPDFGQQWDLPRIHAPQAWAQTQGSDQVRVGVVDTGVDYNHEDLSDGRVIKGPNEVTGGTDPLDDNGHGTHVAGTIGATGNNGKGVAGIAYRTGLVAVKALDANGSGNTSNIAQGVLDAAKLGAKVINLSLGGPQDSQALHDAITQVTQSGTLVVVAAGNDGTSAPTYPAAYPEVLAVGASDSNDQRASFSNYGSYVGIAAPGTNILSTWGTGGYQVEQGTSMASPHVAGAAALLLAKNPTFTPAQLKAVLTTTGDPVSGFPAGVERLNLENALNAVAASTPAPAPSATPGAQASPAPAPTPAPAVPAADTTPPTPPAGVTATAIGPTQVQVQWSASTDDVRVAGYHVYRNGALVGDTPTTSWADGNLAAGTTYSYAVQAYDAAGNPSGTSAAVTVATPGASVPLAVANVALRALSASSATLTWDTTEPAASDLRYVPSTQWPRGPWNTAQDPNQVAHHKVILDHLSSRTTYFLRLSATDAGGSSVQSHYYGFRTL